MSRGAWQAGTGLVYDGTDRVAIDVGYRPFALADGAKNRAATNGAAMDAQKSPGLGSSTSSCNSSESLISLRIDAPFRTRR